METGRSAVSIDALTLHHPTTCENSIRSGGFLFVQT
jgi:hypothetical protein